MLAQMRVVSFCHYLQGPACTQYLADIGADVIKVEPPEGAFERRWSGANTFVDGVSAFLMSANRNKRSLAIDLKRPEARAIMDRREMGPGDRDVTLEGMVREMLRPQLREWLDRNLPYLIERLVKKEIDKMVNRAEMFEDL